MKLNYLFLEQRGNILRVFTPQGVPIADISMPLDGQQMNDYQCMNIITKALAIRWGVIIPKGKSSY